jgi:hypothetical protein
MKHRLINAAGPRTYILILETGDEIAASLHRFAEENKLEGSSFKAIGALSSAKVGWFNWQTKKYETAAEFQEQLEVLSLIGDVALKDGKPVVHAHIIVGRSDGRRTAVTYSKRTCVRRSKSYLRSRSFRSVKPSIPSPASRFFKRSCRVSCTCLRIRLANRLMSRSILALHVLAKRQGGFR